MTLDKGRHCSRCYLRQSISNHWYKAARFGLGLTPDSWICQTCYMTVYNNKRREARRRDYMRDKLMVQNARMRRNLSRFYQRYPFLKEPKQAWHGVF